MRRFVFLGLWLSGCTNETKFVLGEPACKQDYLSWGGGLTSFITQGDGGGSFDYDPAGERDARRAGIYELDSGQFAYNTTHHPDHWRVESRVDGTGEGRGGYAKEDGDLDLWYAMVIEDVLGNEFASEVREIRTGCVVDRQILADGVLTVETGRFEDGRYNYERETDGVTTTGARRPDLTWEESYAIEDGDYTYASTTEGDDDAGTTYTEYDEDDGDAQTSGSVEVEMDGSRHIVESYESAEAEFEQEIDVDYEGNGQGTYTSGDFECDLEFDEGACTYECEDGSSGEC